MIDSSRFAEAFADPCSLFPPVPSGIDRCVQSCGNGGQSASGGAIVVAVQRLPEIPACIAAVQLQPLVAALERLGHSPSAVFARAGLAAADLADPYARLP